MCRASTSAGLYHSEIEKLSPGSLGRHIYVLVKDASDIKRALCALHDRLWVAGFGYFVVGAAGQQLDRSLIDASVYGPERLVFEGAPILKPPLAQDKEKRRPNVFGKEAVDTATAVPPLTEAEQRRLDETKAEAAQRLKPKADKARTSWATKYARKHGLTQNEAERLVTDAVEAHELGREFELIFDNLEPGTVADVIANPGQYTRKSLLTRLRVQPTAAAKRKSLGVLTARCGSTHSPTAA